MIDLAAAGTVEDRGAIHDVVAGEAAGGEFVTPVARYFNCAGPFFWKPPPRRPRCFR